MARTSLSAYRRVYEALRKRAKPGEELGVSETALMEEFGVSRDTARKSLNLLSRDGYARRIQGRGTVLSVPSQQATLQVQVPVNERFFRGSSREPLRQKFFDLMDGIMGAPSGEPCGFSIPLLRAEDPLEKQVASLILPGTGHGLLLVSHSGMEDLVAALRRERYPHVVHAPDGLDLNRVSSNAAGGTRRAVELLLSRGRKRILFIGSDLSLSWHAPLVRVWKSLLESRGLPSDDTLLLPLMEHGGAMDEALRRELAARDFDGVFCCGAERALAAHAVLRQAGRRPGKDVSFISYEDHPDFTLPDSPVSAVRVPVKAMGERMREALIPMLRFGYRDDIRITLEEELVLRGSE